MPHIKSLSKSLLIFFFSVSVSKPVVSQVAITATPFMQINNDARSMGLAGATVAMKGSRNGLHLNPATFGLANTVQISSQFNTNNAYGILGTSWLEEFSTSLRYYTPQVIIGFDDFALGYHYNYIDLGPQVYTRPNDPTPGGVYESYEYAHTFSIAHQVSPYFSWGFGMSFFKSSLARGVIIGGEEIDDAKGVSLDFGLYAEYPMGFEGVTIIPSLGWSLTDFGYPISYTSSGPEDPLPMMMRGGAGLRFDFDKHISGYRLLSVGMYAQLDKVIARREEKVTTINGISDTTYVAMGPFKALVNSWGDYYGYNGGYYKLNVWDQFMRMGGMEITLLEIMSLRFGQFYEHPLNGDRFYNTIGVGFQYKYFTLDYMKYDVKENGNPLSGTEIIQFSLNLPISAFRAFIDNL